ncbi:MAG: DNA polymerase III subunit delta [Ruminococcaceae bacterium]|nr:DNA polymerase III subunit delta [Oscillospiraceae bacterium]
MKELREEISSKNLRNLYLFYGEEDYLKDYYTKSIRECVSPEGGEDFNVLCLNNNFDLTSFENFVNSPPVFNDKKICIIKNTGILKTVSETEKERIKDAILNIMDYLVIVFNESVIDKKGSLYKTISKEGKVIEFKYQKEVDLENWVRRFLQKEKISMSQSDITYFLASVNSAMYDILSEITKLVNYKRKEGVITRDDIDKVATKSVESKVFDMINYMQKNNMEKAYKILDDLKILKTEPVMLVSVIFSEFSKIRKLKLLMDKMPQDKALLEVGIRFFGNEYIRKAKEIPLKKIDEIIFNCQRCDYEIKSGLCDKWLSIKVLIGKSQL